MVPALLKAREAQTVMVNPNFTRESTWEEDGQRGLAALKQRCDGEIPTGISIVIDIDLTASKFCARPAPARIGMKATTREIGVVIAQVMEAHRLERAAPDCFAA